MLLERILGTGAPEGITDRWLISGIGGSRAASGEWVTPETALGLSAYFAAIRNISEDVAKLPVPVYRKAGDAREPLADHPVARVLNVQPNGRMTAMAFRQLLTSWAMGWGNGYAEIVRDSRGRVRELWPIHPSRVTPALDDGGGLHFRVVSAKWSDITIRAADMFVVPGAFTIDGINCVSVAQAAQNSIGRGMAMQKYGSAIFAHGGMDRIAIKHPGDLNEQARKEIRESWSEVYGGADNTKAAILDEGMDVIRFGIPPRDAQLIEAEEYSIDDIARWFRCPPSKLHHYLRAQGWSTLETLNTEYVTDTLTPWAVRWEQEARRRLFADSEGDLYVKHNFGALLRGDSAARSAFYSAMFRIGVMSRDEIRALEDMNPVPGGGTYYVESSNLQPAETVTGADADAGDDAAMAVRWSVVSPVTPDEPVQQDDRKDCQPEEKTEAQHGDSVDRPEEQAPLSAAREAARLAIEEARARCVRKMLKAARTACRKLLDKGDEEGFIQWAERFFAEWERELIEATAPSVATLDAIDGTPGRGMADEWARVASSKRAQLMGVLRDEGVDGVRARLDEWERTEGDYYAKN